MANVGQGITAVVGGIVGFYLGGPTGAAYGFQIGLMAGSALFPTQLQPVFGPRLDDLQTTDAQLGGMVPITYGAIAVPGTVIWLDCVTEVTTTEEVGGKGGPEQEVTTYTYFQSIAYGLCEGEIDGVLRIWENGTLKYDMREQQEGETAEQYEARIVSSAEYASGFVLYYGTEAQLPDPTIEEVHGADSVPAFRGLAYIVYPHRQLRDDQARRHPQMRFEVFRGTVGEQSVTMPTLLNPNLFDSFSGGRLITDWSNGRFFTFDLTGTQGIRAHRIDDNTEYVQRTYVNLFGSSPTTYYGVAGPDGDLYVPFFFGSDDYRVVRFDAETLDIVESGTPHTGFAAQWYKADSIRAIGAGRTEDYLFVGSVLGGIFTVIRCSNLTSAYSLDTTNEDVTVCGSHSVQSSLGGSTTYAYGIGRNTVDPDSVQIYRLTITIPPDVPRIGPQPTEFNIANTASILGSTFDAARPRLIGLNNLVFDTEDNSIIFQVQCSTEVLGDSETYICKVNPLTGAILWAISDLTIASETSNVHSRVGGGRWAFVQTGALNTVIVVNTRDGTYEEVSFAEELAEDLEDGHVSMYDYVSNCMYAYGTESGPIKLCLGSLEPGRVSLAAIISDITARSGLISDDIDVSDLTDKYVYGYAIGRIMPGRPAIEVLRPVGAFDAVESGGVLRFPVRGGSIAASLTAADLGAHEFGSTPPVAITTRKIQDVELPRRIRVHYIAHTRDYEPGEQASETRLTTDSVNDVDIEVPAAIDDDQAAQIADVVWADTWAARWVHETALDVSHLSLDPTDPITVPVDGRNYRVRILNIDDSGGLLRKLEMAREDVANFTSYATADAPRRNPSGLATVSESTLLLLDLPALREEDDNAGIYGAVYRTTAGRNWQGAVIYRSSDNGGAWQQIGTVVTEATVGTVVGAVPEGISTTWDNANEIVVDLSVGKTLESRTEDAVLNGANAAAIGVHGRWEIVQYLNAEQLSSTRWRVWDLLRGRRGTEHFIGTSESGDRFVLISGNGIVRLPLQTYEIGADRLYRAVSIGSTFSSASDQEFAGDGLALKPFSPAHIAGIRNQDGNLTLTWIRRGRLGQELRSGADIPLSEATEAYEVDIANSGIVVRTIETTSQSAEYTAAQQESDFGQLPTGITARVMQISEIVGRGTPAAFMIGGGSGDFPVDEVGDDEPEPPPPNTDPGTPPVTPQPTPPTSPSGSSIKFHPGFYPWFGSQAISNTTNLNAILSFIDQIASNPYIEGIQLISYWADLEGANQGDYSRGFATLDAVLARCALRGKRLMLLMQPGKYGGFASYADHVPAYVVNQYGVTDFNIGGVVGFKARFWEASTADRIIAMTQAYGRRYNSNPYFEMFGLGETAIPIASGTDGYTISTATVQWLRMYQAARAAFPNTALRLCINYWGTDAECRTLIDGVAAYDVCIGGPDIFPNESIQSHRVFTGSTGGTDYRGIIPVVAEVQSPELGGYKGTYTNEQIYLAAMEAISTRSGGATGSGSASLVATYPQYWVWYVNTWQAGAEQKWSTGTLPFINSILGKVGNGTNSTPTVPASVPCPSGYPGCIRT